jgi:hypothetical protein
MHPARFELLSASLNKIGYRETLKERFGKMADNDPEAHLNDGIPDVCDGLTREERVVLYVLHETQKERGGRNVPTAMLWGRVCEHFYISPEELSLMLARLGARK